MMMMIKVVGGIRLIVALVTTVPSSLSIHPYHTSIQP